MPAKRTPQPAPDQPSAVTVASHEKAMAALDKIRKRDAELLKRLAR